MDIFIRFPVYANTIVVLNISTFKGPAYLPFQPRFGNVDLNGSKTRWLYTDNGLLNSSAAFM